VSGFLLDTNCVSELVRVKPEPRVLEWMEAADESLLHLSVLTLGEIRKGLAALPHSPAADALGGLAEVDLRGRFSGRILPVDAAVAGSLGAARRSPANRRWTAGRHRPLSQPDHGLAQRLRLRSRASAGPQSVADP